MFIFVRKGLDDLPRSLLTLKQGVFFSQVKPLAQGEAPHGHFNQPRDLNASNPASIEHHHIQNSPSITKPIPPPIALKPTSVPRTPRSLMNSPIKDREPFEKSPEDPSQKSFLGKLRAFEKMDQFARAQRVLELQQAQDARVMRACVKVK